MIGVEIYWASKLLLEQKTGVLLLLFLDMDSVFSIVSVHKKRFTSCSLHVDSGHFMRHFKVLSRVRKDVNESWFKKGYHLSSFGPGSPGACLVSELTSELLNVGIFTRLMFS
jgi:hypothetical protein